MATRSRSRILFNSLLGKWVRVPELCRRKTKQQNIFYKISQMIKKRYFIWIICFVFISVIIYLKASTKFNGFKILPETRQMLATNPPREEVPTSVLRLVLGPTSVHYNETPLSEQVGRNLSQGITVVSAYFRLPPFPKGDTNNMRSPSSYITWMNAFAWIINPLIIYTDDEEVSRNLNQLLKEKNRTSSKVIMIQRTDLWTFQQLPAVTKILQQENYPIHYPNTVMPAYNCLTHSKFELLVKAIKQNVFHTKYFIWLDIGYFRYQISNSFGLDIPKNFDDRRVGVTIINPFVNGLSLETIIRQNLNFIAGGGFLARYDVLLTFCREYLDFFRETINQKWVGVEQQLLYAMYSRKEKPRTSLQMCTPGWFCLGHLAIQSWKHKQHVCRNCTSANMKFNL